MQIMMKCKVLDFGSFWRGGGGKRLIIEPLSVIKPRYVIKFGATGELKFGGHAP